MKCLRLLFLIACLLGAAQASAQIANLEAGLGFSDDPDAFLLSAELPFQIHEGFSLGPLVQFGLDDDFLFVAPSLDVRYTADLSRLNNAFVKRLRPFAQVGAGLMYIDLDDRPGDDDDASFLLHLGAGAHYRLTQRIDVGTRFNFNIMPDDVFRENFIFTWEVARISYAF